MKKLIFFSGFLLLLLLISCRKEFLPENNADQESIKNLSSQNNVNNSGHIKFAVLSDIHFMHPSLLQNDATNGIAFKKMLVSEPYKVMLEYSPAIFTTVVSEIKNENPRFVLVSGDIVSDGEKVGHQYVAGVFNQLQANGINVYVVPGNNDINSPNAVAYNGNTASPVPNISPAEFLSLYGAYGYNSAISLDPHSLSYVAEAAPSLWILALDAARYSPIYHRSGTLKPETMQWIKQQMLAANQQGITVLGLMHHNVVEHMPGQAGITPYTIVEDLSSGLGDNNNWKARADSLISWGLKVIFTGHSHITDIARRETEKGFLYDIATGSLVTPPCPYRIMVLKNKELEISTSIVKSIPVALPDNLSFTEYSNEFLASNFDKFFTAYLAGRPFYLVEPTLSYSVPLARNAYMAYIKGDENISPIEQMKINKLFDLDPKPDALLQALNSFWNDPAIKDNKWHIKLTNP
jgi:predicted phosphodiesterase